MEVLLEDVMSCDALWSLIVYNWFLGRDPYRFVRVVVVIQVILYMRDNTGGYMGCQYINGLSVSY